MNINMKSLKHHEYVSIGSQSANHRIILLHGWGADAEDLLPLGREIINNLQHQFEIISLRAPNMKPDNNGRQWYSLFPANWEEADRAVEQLVNKLIEFDNTTIPLKKTILLGFSQGAAMTIAAGFKLDMGLIVSCSGYPHPNWCPTKKCPALLSHGLKDDIVPVKASREIYKILKNNSESECSLNEFDGFHEIHVGFIEIIKRKIKEIF